MITEDQMSEYVKHTCPEKEKSVDGTCLSIVCIGKKHWILDAQDCSGVIEIFCCPYCGIKLEETE